MRNRLSIDSRTRARSCENEGCTRPQSPGERFCETCLIERALFRRDERPPLPASRPFVGR